jgi:vacuolar-type H+-ATPase subunit E/Vma4
MTWLSEASKFTEDIMAAAKEKARQIVEQAEQERQRILDEANFTISREANEILRNAQTEAEGIKRREISEVRHQAKLLEQSEKDKILSSVLDAVKAGLRETTRDGNAYFGYLTRLAVDAIRQLGMSSVNIHLTSDDLKRIDLPQFIQEISKLASPVIVEISKEPIVASGGVIVASKDDKIRIVNTFEERLEALEPRMLIEAGRRLFSAK